MLAPVAAEIDSNLQHLREKTTAEEMEQVLQLETNHPPIDDTRDERANRVLELALRNVDLHGWEAQITDDSTRLRLSGGSVSVDLGLSASILRFIEKQG
ncbi:MAG TPA: hypothetical protein VFZ41_04445 [Solirubrobacterales bacterium]